ncbi:N-formylglutamate amidohydrolase [Acidimangrovimonas sediminis]|uniref:N-formylglutamate amidohydrolase n=1 Tax=Acidimangrovimonas sediminis TaxID=2056283 RepID=UPI000C804C36|nr:N-formylglutamate amidohydrolase [Acidimangrovimonas sediminis]
MLQDDRNSPGDTPATLPPLLSAEEAPAVEIVNPEGQSPVVLVCEHAGARVPSALRSLGLPAEVFGRHIAVDLGAEGLARRLAARLDAVLVLQRYSRLVVDCNRPLEARDCIPEVSDAVVIPGNAGLGEAERRRRYDALHLAFHEAVTRVMDRRCDRPTLFVAIHSFTRRLAGDTTDRPWQIGLLFNRDPRLAERLMTALHILRPGLSAAFNQPYAVCDGGDYTIPVHGEGRGVPHVLIEVRNDEIATKEGQDAWAGLLAAALNDALGQGSF